MLRICGLKSQLLGEEGVFAAQLSQVVALNEPSSTLLYPAKVRKIILTIPGSWEDLYALGANIRADGGGYVVAANIISHPLTKKSYVINTDHSEAQMEDAFRDTARTPIPEEELAEIGRSKVCVFIESSTGSISDARDMLEIGTIMLDCGGLGVRIESSGISYSRERWRELATSKSLADLYVTFLRRVTKDGFTSSYGMLSFGLPDCIVSATIPKKERQVLMDRFNYSQIAKPLKLESGGTFGISESSPQYKMTLKCDTRYDPRDTFHNPHGIWHLWSDQISEKTDERHETAG